MSIDGTELCLRSVSNDGCPNLSKQCSFHHMENAGELPESMPTNMRALPSALKKFFISAGGLIKTPVIRSNCG